ncbi:MAG TPA: transcription-repair coupling factor, partial [Aeromicrobium sp.]|nr:transcription-repair coupling factor [Aeromicrobium sp.]
MTEPPLASLTAWVAPALGEGDLQAPAGARVFAAAALAERASPAGDAPAPVLVVTATAREAEDLVDELGDVIAGADVALYPAWETLPHERLSPRSDTVGRRLAVLRRLVHADPSPVRVVVAPVRSLLQPQVRGLADMAPVVLAVGDEFGLDTLVQQLADAAYVRVDLVERRGEFAVRGGIVDVFPPTEEHPLRVEFFGDEVEQIRPFAVADQRSLANEARQTLWAPPCRELLLTEEVRQRAAARAERNPGLREMLTKISEGHAVEGMESLAPVLTSGMEMLVDLLPADARILLCDPERIRARAADLVATSEEFLQASWAAASAGAEAPIDLSEASFHDLDDVLAGRTVTSVAPFGLEDSVLRPVPAYRGDLDQAIVDVRHWLADGRRVAIVVPGHGQEQRTREWLAENDVAGVEVLCGELTEGLVGEGFAIVTHHDLVGQRTAERVDRTALPSRRR